MTELNQTERRFFEIFSNKGNIGPIAEKSRRNFEMIRKNWVSKSDRVFHFCIGHAFKNIDKSVFAYELNEEKEQFQPTQYLFLQKESFAFEDKLFKIICDIRDVNSHYVHTFDKLLVSEIDNSIIGLLKEAFEISVLMTYLKEKQISYLQFKEDTSADTLTAYMCDKFFPNKIYQQEERKKFMELSVGNAIEQLLFIDVTEDIEWKIQSNHFAFMIAKGKYLSFHAHLFLISLFLYKDEANQLISKIKGFKRTEDSYNQKRDIFTFFSKKFTSQDIHSEEKYLVRFRDIIQYLNHYPTIWGKYLEGELFNPALTEVLERHIIETEIFRSFTKYSKHPKRESFFNYATKQLFPHKLGLFNIDEKPLSHEDQDNFEYELNSPLELKDIDEKLKYYIGRDMPAKKYKEQQKLLRQRKLLLKQGSPIKEKLMQRIREEKLIKSYGRNRDRFMDIAVRFLAEENYFGSDAAFKLYRFYTTDEQNVFINSISKSQSDKEKFHLGRLVCYRTISQHRNVYMEWDDPFVFENNSFQIILTLNNNVQKLFSIQRNLLIYLLEDALFNNDSPIEGRGKRLLSNYFVNNLMVDFERAEKVLSTSNSITTIEKNNLKKILPKRLLYKYHAPVRGEVRIENPFQNIVNEALKQENSFKLKYETAMRLNLEEEFLTKNKGKQFKLRFIRKAWHHMFFKDNYKQQAQQHGHHKRFHITREEFNNFCKWMYAFDQVPQYKDYLTRLLKVKGFLNNPEFKSMFEAGNSLDDFYTASKELFSVWINASISKELTGFSTKPTDYAFVFQKQIVYINVSHFISFLESNGYLSRNAHDVIQYRAIENVKYLVAPYYYKDVLSKDEYKSNGKAFNKLKTNRLEDALLYELALRYLHLDSSIVSKAKSDVSALLNSEITFDIKNATGTHLYDLIVPFNKIESLAVLIEHKIEQENNPKLKKTSFLANVSEYLSNPNQHKDIREIAKSFIVSGKRTLKYEQLQKLNNHIISGCIKFSRIQMNLEEYFILKNATILKSGENRIDAADIKDTSGNKELIKLYTENVRKKAFHFGMPPNEGYERIIAQIETKFANLEIKPKGYNSFEELSAPHKHLTRLFMNVLHNDLYKRLRKEIRESEDSTRQRIVEEQRAFEKNYFDNYLK